MWRSSCAARCPLTTNSHSNESKCMLVKRILEKTAQHGFISISRATERSAHHRRQGAIKVGKTGSFPTHGDLYDGGSPEFMHYDLRGQL